MQTAVIKNPGSSLIYLRVNEEWFCYDYKLQPLGQGALGIVYLGFDCNSHQRVAIKKIRDEYTNNRYVRQSARAEASKIFYHPNIVHTIGLCEENQHNGAMYIISEYIPGVTFESFVRTRLNNLSKTERIVRIVSEMRQILDALKYLHNLGILHKDIKPSNIMIDSVLRVKLTDLGISEAYHKQIRTIKEFIGTPQYAAPEMIPESGISSPIDARTDLYAFGVTLYELITGFNPFAGATNDETLHNQLCRVLPENSELPRKLFKILEKATAKEPDKRYQTATEFDNALVEFLIYAQSKNKVRPIWVYVTVIIFGIIGAILLLQGALL